MRVDKEIQPPIVRASARQYYPATLQQQGVFLQAMLDQDRTLWNISHSWRYGGQFNIEALRQAIHTLIRRHPSFRANFKLEQENIVQFFRDNISVDSVMKWLDLSSVPTAEKEAAARQFAEEEARRPYDLEKDPLIRFQLIRLSACDHVLAIHKHHIVSDVTSRRILWRELVALYNAAAANTSLSLEPLPFQYHDYALWQQEFICSPYYLQQKKYWLGQLTRPLPLLKVPADFPTTDSRRSGISIREVSLEPGLLTDLRSLCLRRRVSFSALFLMAYYILLYKYTGQRDMIIGTTYRGRHTNRPMLAKIIGLFANRLPIRLVGDEDADLHRLLSRVDRQVRAAYENQDFLFEDLLRTLQPERSHNQAPVFQVVFNMVKLPDAREEFTGLTRKEWPGFELDNDVSAHYDLSLYVRDNIKNLSLKILYPRDLFRERTIERLSRQYCQLLINIVRQPGKRLADLEIITAEEKNQILKTFNDTRKDYPPDKTVPVLFARQAEQVPDHIAAAGEAGDDRGQITYRLLLQSANRLARQLRHRGVRNNSVVGIMAERSLDMIVGIYGIMSAGAAYLPIDPAYPQERIRFMLADSGAGILLTDAVGVGAGFFPALKLDVISISGLFDSLLRVAPEGRGVLAYVIYTSGSTGRPKGVMIEHRSLANRLNWMQRSYPLDRGDAILQKTAFTFDVSVWEIFWWAVVGAMVLLLAPGGEREPEKIAAAVASHRLTVIHFVPSMLAAFLDYLEQTGGIERLSSLRRVFASGEALTVSQVERFQRLLSRQNGTSLVNLYGPTEATVDVSYYDCLPGGQRQNIPIGKPIDNIQLYVFNSERHLQPIGVPGELCIAGVGLARGYINRPELTADKFVNFNAAAKTREDTQSPKDEILTPKSQPLYRTGDLCRFLSDGNIEFLGRLDFQVKVRGFRIELAEIENHLLNHPQIKEAVVVARQSETGDKTLAAYFTTSKTSRTNETNRTSRTSPLKLRQYLAETLPDYMIPAYFIEMAQIPLTASGKVDRRALPQPRTTIRSQTAYEPPQNQIQHTLAQVWQQVLGLEQVGIHDNFFVLGGDSIKAIQIASRLGSRGWRLDIAAIFRYPFIQALSPYVQEVRQDIDQGTVSGQIEPVPIQKWFLAQRLTNSHHWNLSLMIHRPRGFEPEILTEVCQNLLFHHDLLRAVLAAEGDRLINRGVGDAPISLEVVDLRAEKDAAKRVEAEANRLQSSLDLYSGPLIRFGLFQTDRGDHLLLAAHHLVVDGLSWRILLEDIASVYSQREAGTEICLPAKTLSFKKWSEALQAYSRSPRLVREYDYWKAVCQRAVALPAAGSNSNREKAKQKDYHKVTLELDETTTSQLLNHSHRAYNTEINDLLLGGLSLCFRDELGWPEVTVFLEGHGRESIADGIDISRTVGWFTGLFPVVLEAGPGDDLGLHIRRTKESLRRIPHKGIGYGVLRYLADLSPQERQLLEITPTISFNYMGRFDEDLAAGGFERSPYSAGDSRSPKAEQVFRLTVNALVDNKKLVIVMRADRHALAAGEMEKLAHTYRHHLQQIVRHCRGAVETIYTPADFGAPDLDFEEMAVIQGHFDVKNIAKICHLSPMQAGMLFHHLYDTEADAYTVQLVYTLEGEVDCDLLRKSYEGLLAGYEVFRTAFVYKEVRQPRQVVLKSRRGEFVYHDMGSQLEGIQQADRQRGFDLMKDVLIRFNLIKTDRDRFTLLVTYHHMIMDGWSTNLWLKDLLGLYRDLKNRRQPGLKVDHAYSSYIQWLEDQDVGSAHRYWQYYLSGVDRVTRIESPHHGSRDIDGYEKQSHSLQIDKAVGERLIEGASRLQVTVNNVLQGVWSIVLQRYSGSDDVVFGNVISGRNIALAGVEEVVGLFINTIPFRVRLEGCTAFSQLVQEIRDNLVESQQHGYLPLAEVQGYAAVEGPVLDHLYVYENYPLNRETGSPQWAEQTGFSLSRQYSLEHTHYHLYLTVLPRQELRLHLEYNGKVYERSFIARLAGHIAQVIHQVVRDPDQSVSAIEMVTEAERQQILAEFNRTEADFPVQQTVHGLFADQVEKSPDCLAIRAASGSIYITYRHFQALALRLAGQLRAEGQGSGHIAAVVAERSVETMVAIYGILAAGGAYLPVDPHYPEERINYMLADSAASIVLGGDGCSLPVMTGALAGGSGIGERASEPTSLAYVIYTSGTTGRPKGTLIQHRSLVNRLLWMQKQYVLGRHDTILHKTPFTFDVSVWEIFWWAVVGAGVCLLEPGGERDPRQIVDTVSRCRVTVMHFVPSMLAAFLDYVKQRGAAGQLSALRQVIVSGEALGVSLVHSFQALLYRPNRTALANLYGPTEATIDVSFFDCPLNEPIHLVPIGRPIDNTHLIVLGPNDRLQPVGAAGELCIGGVGLARGYLNRPELTADKFIRLAAKTREGTRSPQSTKSYILNPKSQPLYRTGDLCRFLPDGNLEFLGRLDHQVKIRGFRIELSEIEARLATHPQIKTAVVLAHHDGADDHTLTAYIVPSPTNRTNGTSRTNRTNRTNKTSPAKLREYLSRTLPGYMLPAYFVPIEQVPVTANGKLDRKALPVPNRELERGLEYAAPTNGVEEKLVEIWKDILRLEKIGINDNFFQLGGHSLRAMTLVNEIHRAFEVELPIRLIFDLPTIAEMAAQIRVEEEKRQKVYRILGEIESLAD